MREKGDSYRIIVWRVLMMIEFPNKIQWILYHISISALFVHSFSLPTFFSSPVYFLSLFPLMLSLSLAILVISHSAAVLTPTCWDN